MYANAFLQRGRPHCADMVNGDWLKVKGIRRFCCLLCALGIVEAAFDFCVCVCFVFLLGGGVRMRTRT